jgi:amino acid transporter
MKPFVKPLYKLSENSRGLLIIFCFYDSINLNKYIKKRGVAMESSPRRSMASMSVWLGITSIIFYSTGFIAIILGGVAIVLALLSRGNSKKLTRKAVIGLVIGIMGVSITYITVAVIAYRIFTDPSVVAAVEAFRQSNTIDNYNNLYDAIMNSTGVIPQ